MVTSPRAGGRGESGASMPENDKTCDQCLLTDWIYAEVKRGKCFQAADSIWNLGQGILRDVQHLGGEERRFKKAPGIKQDARRT